MVATEHHSKSLRETFVSTVLLTSPTVTSNLKQYVIYINSNLITIIIRVRVTVRESLAANVINRMSDSAIDTGSVVSHDTSISQLNDKYENLHLEFVDKEVDVNEAVLKSPKSPICPRLPHQSSLGASVDVEDRKTLRDALYQGIFHRHRRTIFAVGSFLRMLRTRNSQYNTIRTTSDADDTEPIR